MNRRIRFFTRDTLIAANKVAIKTDRNRTLWPTKLETLDPELRMPIVFSIIHNDVELRCWIAVDAKPTLVWLDIPFKTYYALPEVEVTDEELAEADARVG